MKSKQLFLKLKHNFRCTFFDCSIASLGELFYKTNSKWSKPKHKKKRWQNKTSDSWSVSGFPRFKEGSGKLLFSGTEAGRGVQLWQPFGNHSNGLWPAASLQLLDDIRGGPCGQAQSGHFWSGPAEVRGPGRQRRPRWRPLCERLPELPSCGHTGAAARQTQHAESARSPRPTSTHLAGGAAILDPAAHGVMWLTRWSSLK